MARWMRTHRETLPLWQSMRCLQIMAIGTYARVFSQSSSMQVTRSRRSTTRSKRTQRRGRIKWACPRPRKRCSSTWVVAKRRYHSSMSQSCRSEAARQVTVGLAALRTALSKSMMSSILALNIQLRGTRGGSTRMLVQSLTTNWFEIKEWYCYIKLRQTSLSSFSI